VTPRPWFERRPAPQKDLAKRRLLVSLAVFGLLVVFDVTDDLIEGFGWTPHESLRNLSIAIPCAVVGAQAATTGSRLQVGVATAIVAVAGAETVYFGHLVWPFMWQLPWDPYSWWPYIWVYSIGIWLAADRLAPLWPVAVARRAEAFDAFALLVLALTPLLWQRLRHHGGPGTASLITALVILIAFSVAVSRRHPIPFLLVTAGLLAASALAQAPRPQLAKFNGGAEAPNVGVRVRAWRDRRRRGFSTD
jgi:hypothetical protein